jgi:phage tail protein X
MTRQINGAVATSETAELTVSRDGIATHVKWSFTIDAPVLTSIVPSNAAPTAAASLTLSGINFGNRAIMDLAVAIGETPAATITAWISGTSFVMEAQRAASSSRAVITAGLSSDKAGAAILAHTSAIAFAYDAPVVTAVLSGGVAQTVVSTISGANFGVADWTATVRIGVTLGLGTRWVSDTSLVVRLSLYPTPAPNRATQPSARPICCAACGAAGHKRFEAAADRTRERGRGHGPQGRVEFDGGISGGGGAPAVCMLGVVQLQRLVQVARLRGNCRAQAAELHMLRPS